MATIDELREKLRKTLSPEQYRVVCECGTEPPFDNEYWDCKTPGTYYCIVCDRPLFSSEHKYDSGTGWPSFYAPISEEAVEARPDYSHGMVRTEVVCAGCKAHLGHVFPDGPPPTGLRFCINSASLRLRPRQEKETPGR